MKKIFLTFSVLLVLCLTFSVTAACSKKHTSPTVEQVIAAFEQAGYSCSSSSADEGTSVTATKSDGTVEITMIVWYKSASLAKLAYKSFLSSGMYTDETSCRLGNALAFGSAEGISIFKNISK